MDAINTGRLDRIHDLTTVLQGDPRYAQMNERALTILQARDRIPMVSYRPDGLYNFWQDADHVQGILRRTTLASYRTATPEWEIVLDVDALSRAEGKNWVYQGMQCLPPEERRCLVTLSDGGRDANYVREFDLRTKQFVEGGFSLPEGKQNVTWVDADTILVAREWGPGTMTQSGYPFVIKRLRRGQTLAQAEEVFRGQASDVRAGPMVLRDPQGEDGAGGTHRVPQGDRSAVRVGALRVQPGVADHGDGLRGEGLVELHDIDVVGGEAGPLEEAAQREDRGDPAHHATWRRRPPSPGSAGAARSRRGPRGDRSPPWG